MNGTANVLVGWSGGTWGQWQERRVAGQARVGWERAWREREVQGRGGAGVVVGRNGGQWVGQLSTYICIQ